MRIEELRYIIQLVRDQYRTVRAWNFSRGLNSQLIMNIEEVSNYLKLEGEL